MAYKISSFDDICCFRPITDKRLRVFWEITRRCNLNCIHCQIDKSTYQEPALNRLKKLIQELSLLQVGKLKITGGEPLLYKNIQDIISYATENGLEIDITSNGTLINEKVAKDLKKCGVDSVSISLNGHSETIHDKIQGEFHAFERSLNGIQALKKHEIDVDVNSIVCKINYEYLDNMIDFVHDLSVRSLNLIGLFWKGKAAINRTSLELNQKEIEHCYRVVQQKRQFLSSFPIRTTRLFAKPPFQECPAGESVIGIDYEGYLHPCLNLTTGNSFDLNKLSIASAYSSREFKGIVKKIQSLACKDMNCTMKECGKGCRRAALDFSEDVLSSDPLCDLQVNDSLKK